MLVVEDWLKIIRRLEDKGWTQYREGDSRGPNCLQGAINFAVGYSKEFEVRIVLCRELGIHIMWWNDAPDRTKEEVISLLHCMAAREAQ